MTTATKGPETLNGVAHGYLPALRPRYRWVECGLTDWTEEGAPEGEAAGEPFRVEIRSNLTFGEIDDIKAAGNGTWNALFTCMAPYVRAWNALAVDVATGEPAPVPPPMEAGPDVFQVLALDTAAWLARELQTLYLGGEERGKGSAKPGRSGDPPNGDVSA